MILFVISGVPDARRVEDRKVFLLLYGPYAALLLKFISYKHFEILK